jgi:hypothetical protein
MIRTRHVLALGATLLAAGLVAQRVRSARAQDQAPEVTVYKSPT